MLQYPFANPFSLPIGKQRKNRSKKFRGIAKVKGPKKNKD